MECKKGNNLYDADALLELVKPFSDPKVGAVTGSKNIMDDPDAHAKADSLYWRYESWIKKNETRLGSCTGVAGEILAIRRNRSVRIWASRFTFGMTVIFWCGFTTACVLVH